MIERTREITQQAAKGTIKPERSHWYRDPYTSAEIAALRADPQCILPNRTLGAQWLKCKTLGIPRDPSLRAIYAKSPEAEARKKARARMENASPSEATRAGWRRHELRRRVRKNPGPVLDELRKLARGHPQIEDLVIEGYATVLRLAVPAAEAFQVAKAEINRTSAQPFREQSFDADVDYEARWTGRQAPKASDIRAARGDG